MLLLKVKYPPPSGFSAHFFRIYSTGRGKFLGQESRFFHVFFAYLHSLIPDDYYHGKRLFPDY